MEACVWGASGCVAGDVLVVGRPDGLRDRPRGDRVGLNRPGQLDVCVLPRTADIGTTEPARLPDEDGDPSAQARALTRGRHDRSGRGDRPHNRVRRSGRCTDRALVCVWCAYGGGCCPPQVTTAAPFRRTRPELERGRDQLECALLERGVLEQAAAPVWSGRSYWFGGRARAAADKLRMTWAAGHPRLLVQPSTSVGSARSPTFANGTSWRLG